MATKGIYTKIKGWQLLLFTLNIGLMASCSFDGRKNPDRLDVVQNTIPQAKLNKEIKLSAGPAFPFTKRAACCKGVPSRAKALSAKVTSN
jgi:hypothetical protein